MKQDVRKLTFDKLKDYVLETGLPAFRAKQIWEWIWVKSAHNFDEMSNLSLTMRAQLAKDFDILPISVQTDQKSNDGTIKLAFALHDKSLVEGVLIPAEDRILSSRLFAKL
jgi:23S rRNA (adenine2503-C2)-methyltransferase